MLYFSLFFLNLVRESFWAKFVCSRRMICELLCWSPSWWHCATPASLSSRGGPSSTDSPTSFSFLQMILGSTMSRGTTQPCRSYQWQERLLSSSTFMNPQNLLWHNKGLDNSSLQAPTLASLAKEGVVLEQNYVQPKCAPSRAALMTGDPEDPSHLILSSRTRILT